MAVLIRWTNPMLANKPRVGVGVIVIAAVVLAIVVAIAASLLSLNVMAEGLQVKPNEQPAAVAKVQWPKLKSAIVKDPALEARVEKILAGMTLKEKVGQVIQPQITSISPAEVTKYHIGSVLSAGGSYPAARDAEAISWVGAANKFYNASVKNSKKRSAIPIIWGIDAVHGHNNVVGATIFPHNIGLGATRNPGLIRQIGEVTAREVTVTGIGWTFAPTVAVARDQRWGRTYESYSENPALVAELAAAMVVGLQGHPARKDLFGSDKVVATVKHFLGDGGTDLGDDQGDTLVDEKTLRDIHAPGFVAALDAGAQTVMASFNSWNGVKSHGNGYLLTEVLKNQMGFDGFVVGDWNGHEQVPGCSAQNCAAAFNAGVDLIMVPDAWRDFYNNTLRQVKRGTISQARLDDAVRRILRVKMRSGMFEKGKPSELSFAGRHQILGHPKHRAVARQAVRESLVLLKNDNNVLPINPGKKIFVTGASANNLVKQCGGWTVTWQGDDTSASDFPGGTSIFSGFERQIKAAGGQIELGKSASFKQKPDVAIVVFGEKPYAEAKGDIEGDIVFADEQANLEMIKKLTAQGIPVVNVFVSGRPMWVNPSIEASDAFVAAWLPGTEGDGVADVLLSGADGKVQNNFVGKLSFSWPERADQIPLNIGDKDYAPKFPFGYGLSY